MAGQVEPRLLIRDAQMLDEGPPGGKFGAETVDEDDRRTGTVAQAAESEAWSARYSSSRRRMT